MKHHPFLDTSLSLWIVDPIYNTTNRVAAFMRSVYWEGQNLPLVRAVFPIDRYNTQLVVGLNSLYYFHPSPLTLLFNIIGSIHDYHATYTDQQIFSEFAAVIEEQIQSYDVEDNMRLYPQFKQHEENIHNGIEAVVEWIYPYLPMLYEMGLVQEVYNESDIMFIGRQDSLTLIAFKIL